MPDRIEFLIQILLDNDARDDERDDAALDLGQFNDDRALNALLQIATDHSLEKSFFIDVCGEAIANILILRNDYRRFKQIFWRLTPLAQQSARNFVQVEKPDWLNDEPPA